MAIFEFDVNCGFNFVGVIDARFSDDALNDPVMKVKYPKEWAPELFAIIWIDKEGHYHSKGRLKFPQSGNKQSMEKRFDKGATLVDVLNTWKQLPLTGFEFHENKSGTLDGLFNTIRENGMIDWEHQCTLMTWLKKRSYYDQMA